MCKIYFIIIVLSSVLKTQCIVKFVRDSVTSKILFVVPYVKSPSNPRGPFILVFYFRIDNRKQAYIKQRAGFNLYIVIKSKNTKFIILN